MIRAWEPNLTEERRSLFFELVRASWGDVRKRDSVLVKVFESFIAGRHAFKGAVATSNAGSAIELLLWYFRRKGYNTLIVPSVSHYSDAVSGAMLGYRIVVVDVRDDYPIMSEDLVAEVDCNRDRSILLPVLELGVWSRKYVERLSMVWGGEMIIDASHCYGLPIGSSGGIAVMSFFTTKMLDGDNAGAVLSDDVELLDVLRDMREYGRGKGGPIARYASMNYGLSELSAAYLISGIFGAEERLVKARKVLEYLRSRYGGRLLTLNESDAEYNGYIIGIRVRDRKKAEKMLNDCGVEPWSSTIVETTCDYLSRFGIPYKGECIEAEKYVKEYVYLSSTIIDRTFMDTGRCWP